jgi:EAL domain-containing protein (putative c-di-GMP-specific phosphodiesterase class I)
MPCCSGERFVPKRTAAAVPANDLSAFARMSARLPSDLLTQLAEAANDGIAPSRQTLASILQAIRQYLDMDVAFLSEFSNGQRVFRMVDAISADSPVAVGAGDPLETTYCQRLVDGRLPEVLPDASAHPVSAVLPITQALGIGSYIGVPVALSDGRLYGTLCCFRDRPDTTLNERDLGLLQVFANMAAVHIEHEALASRRHHQISDSIRKILETGALSVVYQPICHVSGQRIAGVEALSRFATVPRRSPDLWFNEAAGIGMAQTLEVAAIRMALQALQQLPEDLYVSINASPDVVLSGVLSAELVGMPCERIVLEITEHALVTRYEDLLAALSPLRSAGVRIAVDDAGAGHSSLRHILQLAPDIIKLDVSLTRHIDTDTARRALAAALAEFARETGAKIVAEGIETLGELATLTRIGIPLAQGYLLGLPMTAAEVAAQYRRPQA